LLAVVTERPEPRKSTESAHPVPLALTRNLTEQLGAALAQAAKALEDAARLLCASPDESREPITLGGALTQFLAAKRLSGCRPRYLSQIRCSLGSLVDSGGSSLPLDAIDPARLSLWLDGNGWSARTRAGYLTDAKSFLGWCQRRGWIAGNPASALDRPRAETLSAALHTPEQVQSVLRAAQAQDPPLCRFLALCYFAGLRWSEASRTTESDIRGGYVHVPAERSKTRSRRVVEIQPALESFLSLPGRLPLTNIVRRWKAVREACGVVWPPNVTRHCFCTYHLARFGNAAKTALEAGHAESVLFRHYREAGTKENAVAFWDLRAHAET
jgi:integrase